MATSSAGSSDAIIDRLNTAAKTATEKELTQAFTKEWSVTKTDRERTVLIVLNGTEIQDMSNDQLGKTLVSGTVSDRVRCAILIGRRRTHKYINEARTGLEPCDDGLFKLADATLQRLILQYPILCDGRLRVALQDPTFTSDVYPSRSVFDWMATTPGLSLPVISNSTDKEAAKRFALHPCLKPSLGHSRAYYSNTTVLDNFFVQDRWVTDSVTRFQQVNLLMLINLLEISADRLAMKSFIRPPAADLFHLTASLQLRDQLGTCLGAATYFGANPVFSAYLYDDLAGSTAKAIKSLAQQYSSEENFAPQMRRRALEAIAFLLDTKLDWTPDPFIAGQALCNGMAEAELCSNRVEAGRYLFDQLVGSCRISRRNSFVVNAEPRTILSFIDGVRSASGAVAPEPEFRRLIQDAVAANPHPKIEPEIAIEMGRYERLLQSLDVKCTEQSMLDTIQAEKLKGVDSGRAAEPVPVRRARVARL